MSHERITVDSELRAIEEALGSLVAARSRIDRDLIMFRAGQAAVQRSPRSRRAWIASAASLGVIALAEAFALAHRPPPRIVERVVVVREPARPEVEASPERTVAPAPPASEAWSSGDVLALWRTPYERLAEQVLRYGLDGLPAPPATAWTGSEPQSSASRQLLQEEIHRVLDPGDHS
jgi:hypothetical protein